MADSVKVAVQPRTTNGSQAARRLRRQGLIPAVIYGHKEDTVSITLAAEEIEKIIRHGVHVVDLQVDGKTEKTLIREVQWDHLGKDLLHVDFARIAADERVVVTVPLTTRGTAPGVAQGGVLDQPLHSLSVECLAIQVPESIRVNVGELKLGEFIHVKDLVLPEGVKAMTDPDVVVVHVAAKQVEEEAAPAAAAAESAEPELIGRQKAAEEEGE